MLVKALISKLSKLDPKTNISLSFNGEDDLISEIEDVGIYDSVSNSSKLNIFRTGLGDPFTKTKKYRNILAKGILKKTKRIA